MTQLTYFYIVVGAVVTVAIIYNLNGLMQLDFTFVTLLLVTDFSA